MFPTEPGEEGGSRYFPAACGEDNDGADTLQSMENSTLAQVDMTQRKLHPLRALTGAGPWKKLWAWT